MHAPPLAGRCIVHLHRDASAKPHAGRQLAWPVDESPARVGCPLQRRPLAHSCMEKPVYPLGMRRDRSFVSLKRRPRNAPGR